VTEYSEWYSEYLQGRSLKGLWYRRLWLYPRLRRYLKGRVLDVGSGIGDFLRGCPGSVGVDVNPHLVEWCREQGLDVRLMTEGNLPFAEHSVDGVNLDNVLEHIEEPAPLLREIHRVLRPGGVFVVGVPGPRGFETAPDHKVFYDEAKLVQVIGAAGFAPHRVFHMPVPSKLLYYRMPQYCLYGVFHRTGDAGDATPRAR
jgi:SAM-dependent methyltransferase